MNTSAGIIRGRPYGGLGVLWRKSFGPSWSVSVMDDDRLMRVDISNNNRIISIFNVYLPYDDGSNRDEFQMYLGKIDSELSNWPYSCAIGDFNANTRDGSSRFGQEFIRFCAEESLIVSDSILAPSDTFTFLSNAHATVAWIDHVVSTRNFHSLIDAIWTDRCYVSSDHFPVFIRLNVDKINLAQSTPGNQLRACRAIKWDTLDELDLETYRTESNINLSQVKLNHSLLLCDDIMCNDPSHYAAIDTMYNAIVEALNTASECIRSRKVPSHKQIAGWNEICTELHSSARDAFLLWVNCGKPRHGHVLHMVQSSRARFKQALRQCKAEQSKHVSDSLASKMLHQDSKSFWKLVKRINHQDQETPLAESIEGRSGQEEVTELWRKHFSSLLNSTTSAPVSIHQELLQDNYERFTLNYIASAISELKNGKTQGLDNLYAEHKKMQVINLVLFCAWLLTVWLYMDTFLLVLWIQLSSYC